MVASAEWSMYSRRRALERVRARNGLVDVEENGELARKAGERLEIDATCLIAAIDEQTEDLSVPFAPMFDVDELQALLREYWLDERNHLVSNLHFLK
jgi:hypothetical protein